MKKGIGKLSLFPACCIGTVAGLIITLGASAIGAVFITNEYLALNTEGTIGLFIQFCSVLLGAILSAYIVHERKVTSCIAVGAAYYVILLILGILLFDGLTGAISGGLLAATCGCAAAIFLCGRKKNRPKRKKSKTISR